jgi:hypothetical protein
MHSGDMSVWLPTCFSCKITPYSTKKLVLESMINVARKMLLLFVRSRVPYCEIQVCHYHFSIAKNFMKRSFHISVPYLTESYNMGAVISLPYNFHNSPLLFLASHFFSLAD